MRFMSYRDVLYANKGFDISFVTIENLALLPTQALPAGWYHRYHPCTCPEPKQCQIPVQL